MKTQKLKKGLQVLGLFFAFYLAYVGLLWLPILLNFEVTGTGAVIYAAINVLPFAGVFAIYLSIFKKADEFFQRLFLVATSFAFMLAALYGIISITFSRYGIDIFLGSSIWNVLVISWLVSFLFFLLRNR